jgi:hypothetical protein
MCIGPEIELDIATKDWNIKRARPRNPFDWSLFLHLQLFLQRSKQRGAVYYELDTKIQQNYSPTHHLPTRHSSTDDSACCRELGSVISNFEPVGFAVGKYVPFRSNAWINIQTTHRYIAPVTVNAWHQTSTFDAESRAEAVCSRQVKLLNASLTADPLQGLSGIENVGSVGGTS